MLYTISYKGKFAFSEIKEIGQNWITSDSKWFKPVCLTAELDYLHS